MARTKHGLPGIYNQNNITLANEEGAAIALDVNGFVKTSAAAASVTAIPTFSAIANGELAGATSATQFPDVACRMIKIKAQHGNVGRVYIGGSGVTVAAGTTDTTTGLELSPGDETGWILVSNANVFYRICENAGDDITYLALVS